VVFEKLKLTHFVGFHKSYSWAGLSPVNSISAGSPKTVSTTGRQQTISNMAESNMAESNMAESNMAESNMAEPKPLRYVDVCRLFLTASPSKGYATHG
jgi:hypothetical protein